MSDDEVELPPVVERLLVGLNAAAEAFSAELQRSDPCDTEDRQLIALNAQLRFLLAFGDAMDRGGFKPGRKEIRKLLLKCWRPSAAEPQLGLRRATAVSIAYAENYRLDDAGSKDSPMQAALQFVARTIEFMNEDGSETLRKSIQRYRRQIRGTSVYRLNPDTLMIERSDAEKVYLKGLPRKAGRPRKRGEE